MGTIRKLTFRATSCLLTEMTYSCNWPRYSQSKMAANDKFVSNFHPTTDSLDANFKATCVAELFDVETNKVN